MNPFYVTAEVTSPAYTKYGSHNPNLAAMQGIADSSYDTLKEVLSSEHYRLDLRVEFSSVTNFGSYAEIVINAGTIDSSSENVRVEFLSGSTWGPLDFDPDAGDTRDHLDTGINVATVTLSSGYYAIRFVDQTLGHPDHAESNWQIDNVYLR
jgi:hypothetical protein